MTRLNGRIPYRLFIALYLSFAICAFLSPHNIAVYFADNGDIGAVIKGLVILFAPYIFLALVLVAITIVLRLRHSSASRRKTALVFSIFSLIMVVVSIVFLLRMTSLRWAEIYANTGSMAGGAEWIMGWIGGCASGLFVLSVNYLFLIRRSKTTPE